MSTREEQINDALGTAIKASEVALELAQRLASRVSLEEAESLIATALGRFEPHVKDDELVYMRDTVAQEYGLPVQALASRILAERAKLCRPVSP